MTEQIAFYEREARKVLKNTARKNVQIRIDAEVILELIQKIRANTTTEKQSKGRRFNPVDYRITMDPLHHYSEISALRERLEKLKELGGSRAKVSSSYSPAPKYFDELNDLITLMLDRLALIETRRTALHGEPL